MPLITER